MTEPIKKPTRRRARKADGKYRGDDPTTTVNEAWESVEIEQAVGDKSVDYSVRQKVSTTSESTPGKYAKKSKVRPTFGSVTSESK